MKKSLLYFFKIIFLLIGFIAGLSGAYAAEKKEFRFSNTMACGGVKVEVLSICGEKSDEGINYSCATQSISFEKNDHISIRKDLLEKESFDNFHIATSLRCVSTNLKKYVYILLNNGGNCDDCEVGALIDLSGKWIFYGDRWFVSGSEKTRIRKSEKKWLRVKPLMIDDETIKHD